MTDVKQGAAAVARDPVPAAGTAAGTTSDVKCSELTASETEGKTKKAGLAGDADGAEAAEEAEEKEEPALPPLTAHEFRQYNRLSEHMNYIHDHFRSTWTRLYTATTTGKRPNGMSLRQFIDEGLQLVHHLTAHHNIEETYFFPMLAKKMPEFKSSIPPGRKAKGKAEKQQALLLRQHQLIHAGMDGFEEYLEACKTGEKDFKMSVMREKMDSWGTVLWEHLDLEVKTLGAENMRRYWTLEEMRKFPM